MRSSYFFILILVNASCLFAQNYWSKTFEVHPGTEQVWQMTVRGLCHIDGVPFQGVRAWKISYMSVKLDLEAEIQNFNKLHEVSYKFYTTFKPWHYNV